MYYIQNNASVVTDTEHVFSLFYEIKQEFPLLDETRLMGIINRITGWEYPSNKKREYKETIKRLLRLKR